MDGYILKDRAYEESYEHDIAHQEAINKEVAKIEALLAHGKSVMIGEFTFTADNIADLIVARSLSNIFLTMAFSDDKQSRAEAHENMLPLLEEWAEENIRFKREEDKR